MLPFGETLREIGAEMGAAALLTDQGGFGYQSAKQYQIAQFVGGTVYR